MTLARHSVAATIGNPAPAATQSAGAPSAQRQSQRLPRVLPAGDAALVVELGEGVSAELNDAVQHLDRAILDAELPGVIETVPTYRSILVNFDPAATDGSTLAELLLALSRRPSAAGAGAVRRWRIPVCFGGDHGEDLDEVAARAGMSAEAVIACHCAADYRVYMLGFSPGFAYLGGLPDALHQPRRENPRAVTPAGSIMQGGAQVAISPLAMPSGWHLIGRTPIRTFDLSRPDPFLIGPGDRIRFAAIAPADYDRLAADPDAWPVAEVSP